MKYRARTCEVCQIEYAPTWHKQRTCGRKCGVELQRRNGGYRRGHTCKDCGVKSTSVVWKLCPDCRETRAKAVAERVAMNAAKPKYERRSGVPWTFTCKGCGLDFTIPKPYGRPRSYCRPCRKRREYAQKRAQDRAARRSNMYGNAGTRKRKRIAERDKWTCQLCLLPIPQLTKEHINDPRYLEIDHIIPLSRGGSSGDKNLQATHRACNSIKADRAMDDPIVALLRAQIAAN